MAKIPTTNAAGLRKLVAKKCGYKMYEVEDVLSAMVIVIQDELLAGRRVRLDDLGTFMMKHRAASEKYNSIRKEKIMHPAKNVVMYKPDPRMKRALNPGDTSVEDSDDEESDE